jgi:hypothetical protein
MPPKTGRLPSSRSSATKPSPASPSGLCALRPGTPSATERRLRERLDALGPLPAPEPPHVLMLPDFDRADRIGEFWGYPKSRTFAELLIDCDEDRTLAGRCWLACCGRRTDRDSAHREPGPLGESVV